MHPRQRLTNRTPFWGDGAKDSHADAGSEASALGLSSPKASGAAQAAFFELLKRKRQRQKQHEAKAHWGRAGAGLPPAPAQGGKCEAFQGFVFSAVARQFYTLVK